MNIIYYQFIGPLKNFISRLWKEYSVLIIIAFLQVIPPVLGLFHCLDGHEWISSVVSIIVIILVIVIREIRSRKAANSIKKDIGSISAATVDISANTVYINERVEQLGPLLKRMEDRIYQLEHHKGYNTYKR